ncbi:hypothetical protein ACLKA6_004178 [Drosophila palustris]
MPLLLVNNGHTVNMELTPNGPAAYIKGGMLRDRFVTQCVHFHWGSLGTKGSEHAFNGDRYDAEIHIIHKNAKYSDKSVEEASKLPDGLAVLAIMINAVLRVEDTPLNKIFDALPQVIQYNSNGTIYGYVTVQQFLGDIDTTRFYTYKELSDEAVEVAPGEFNYDKQGADWTGTCRNGKQQSPIDFEDRTIITKYLPRIRFEFYNTMMKSLTVINNGLTVSIDLPVIAPISKISGGLMRDEFQPMSIHFHWGSPNSMGSEHAFNHERYDVEMHIVHKNLRYFDKSVGEASGLKDGLAVLAIMLKAAPVPRLEANPLYKIFDTLPQIIPYQSNATINGDFSLKQLLNHVENGDYYSYKGSLTTPDCGESVTWTVFKNVVHFPQSEISKLWSLRDSRNRPLINNYRKLQDINYRYVYYRPDTAGNMNIFYIGGLGLKAQFLLLSAFIFGCSLAELQLSDEYLSDIRADAAVDNAAGEYNYDRQGADWEGTCQEGRKQSPIDLLSSDAIVESLPEIRFQNYDQNLQTPLLVVNNGYSANMVLPPNVDGKRASISGGLLPGVFEAQSVHLHWGSRSTMGSEHAINYERFDVEIHVVHKNVKYSNLTEASENSDGLAVLGVMLRASRRSRLQRTGLNRIFDVLPQIIPYEANATITDRLTVKQLLGNISPAEFFTYEGSLTTPGCAESVTWTVFKDVASFPESQISKLWNLRDSRQRELINNYRELQRTNDRLVFFRPRR